MTKRGYVLIWLVILAALVPVYADAQSSLGIGNSEATAPSTGLFSRWLSWINTQQQEFYRELTGALKAMREGERSAWPLIALSFAYGIFHAAGPGHGKAVISSYMLANETALRRGVLLSFVSAALQAVTALVVMAAVFLLLRGSSISMTDTAQFLEVSSYALIALFGLWLLWRKLSPVLKMQPQLAIAGHTHGHQHDHHGHQHHNEHHDDHHHGDSEVCSTCGHSHAPDPKMLGGERFSFSSAWSAVVAVGIRPCSGALIVLTFAFLNSLWFAGVVSVFAMAAGTAITVSVFATLAVTAKNVAMRISGGGVMGARVHDAIEIGGALLVLLLGLTLFSAAVFG